MSNDWAKSRSIFSVILITFVTSLSHVQAKYENSTQVWAKKKQSFHNFSYTIVMAYSIEGKGPALYLNLI